MKINLATRVLNEMYFLDTFIQYYLDMGVDEIHFFDSESTDDTAKTIKSRGKKNPAVKLIRSHKKLRLTSYKKEVEVCNLVLRHAIDDYKKRKEDIWWLLVDIDEFVQPPPGGLRNFLQSAPHDIIRCVFFEWYLPPHLAEKKLSAPEVREKIAKGEAKGKLTDLWGDPFYKDYVLHLSPQTAAEFSRLRIIAGNHRFLLDRETVVPPNTPFLVIDHLRGVDIDVTRARIDKCLLLLEESQQKMQDNWTYEHYIEKKKEITDYRNFYENELKTKEELEALLEHVGDYDNSASLYNKMIYGT